MSCVTRRILFSLIPLISGLLFLYFSFDNSVSDSYQSATTTACPRGECRRAVVPDPPPMDSSAQASGTGAPTSGRDFSSYVLEPNIASLSGIANLESKCQQRDGLQIKRCCSYSRDHTWSEILSAMDIRTPRIVCPSPFSDIPQLRFMKCVHTTCGHNHNYFLKFVPLESARGTLSPTRLNVIYLFLDGVTRTVVEKRLFRTLRELGRTHRRLKFPTAPTGLRRNHPSMMSGWSSADQWFDHFLHPTGAFRKRMFKLLSGEEKEGLQHDGGVGFREVRGDILAAFRNDSLFTYFKSEGYVTQAVSGNDEIDPSAGVMSWWNNHPHIDYENFELATTAPKVGGVLKAVGQRHVMEYAADVVLQMFHHHRDVPKFSFLYDGELLGHSDAAYKRLFKSLEKFGMRDRTAVVIMSPHVSADIMADVWLPKTVKLPFDIADTTEPLGGGRESRSFMTHADWHVTVRHLATLPGEEPRRPHGSPRDYPRAPPKGVSLLTKGTMPPRSCESQNVPTLFCPYKTVAVLSATDKTFVALLENVRTVFAKYNGNTESVRDYCVTLPLPATMEGVRTFQTDTGGSVAASVEFEAPAGIFWQATMADGATDVVRARAWGVVNAECYERCMFKRHGKKQHNRCENIARPDCACAAA